MRRGILDTTLCDKVCQWLATGRWFSPGPPVSSTNKTDRHHITEILLKVALKHHKLNPQTPAKKCILSSIPIYNQLLFKFCQFENTLKSQIFKQYTFIYLVVQTWVTRIFQGSEFDKLAMWHGPAGGITIHFNSHNSFKIWTLIDLLGFQGGFEWSPRIPCLGVCTQCLSHKSCYNK